MRIDGTQRGTKGNQAVEPSYKGRGFSSQPAISHHQFTLHAVDYYSSMDKVIFLGILGIFVAFILTNLNFHLWVCFSKEFTTNIRT